MRAQKSNVIRFEDVQAGQYILAERADHIIYGTVDHAQHSGEYEKHYLVVGGRFLFSDEGYTVRLIE